MGKIKGRSSERRLLRRRAVGVEAVAKVERSYRPPNLGECEVVTN